MFWEDMKNQGKLIAKGERNGRMFTLDVNMLEVNSMLFTHGKGAGDIRILEFGTSELAMLISNVLS